MIVLMQFGHHKHSADSHADFSTAKLAAQIKLPVVNLSVLLLYIILLLSRDTAIRECGFNNCI